MPTTHGFDRLSPSQQHLIDELCDRFESQLHGRKVVEYDPYLTRVGSSEKSKLLFELLLIDFEYQQLTNSPIDLEQYYQRFPDHRLTVNDAWHRFREQANQATRANADDTPTASPHLDWIPPKIAVGSRLDTYLVIKKLGEGGMGTVWKARHVKLDRFVALKVLQTYRATGADAERRFEREMRALGKLDHAHVVRAMDAREVNGLHFLVMEYVEGTDLGRYIKTRGTRRVVDACVMLRHAALGLAAAHAQGIVHRDIKPSNLLFSKRGRVKVSDLGLSRLLTEGSHFGTLTKSDQMIGTPDYMAPEQWDDLHQIDYRVDLYALGCTLFYLLNGRAPYDDSEHSLLSQKMKGHLFEAPPRLSDLRSDIPEEVEQIYLQLMEKDPTKRVITAKETAALLKKITSQKK